MSNASPSHTVQGLSGDGNVPATDPLAALKTEPCPIANTHTVHAADPSQHQRLGDSFPLGPLDSLVSTAVPIAVCFVYRSQDKKAAIDLDRLRDALSRLLDHYPQLTGRLRVDERNNRCIDRLGSDVHLYEARCDAELPAGDLSLTDLPGDGNSFLPPFDPSLERVCADPILAVKYTAFSCGAVCLGVRCHHSISDGAGFFNMVGHLAELYSGATTLKNPPVIVPYLADFPATEAERAQALTRSPKYYTLDPAPVALPGEPLAQPVPSSGRVLRLSPTYLAELKTRATPPGGRISTFTAICTQICLGAYRARSLLRQNDSSLAPLTPPDFLTSSSIRELVPSMPHAYFPNAVGTPVTPLDTSALDAGDLRAIAKVLHDLFRSRPSAQEMEDTLRWVAAQPDRTSIRSSYRGGSGSMAIAQWSKFDVYGLATFAGTVPALVAPPFTQISTIDGLGYTLPLPRADGDDGEKGLLLNLALSEPLWAVIDHHDLFGLKDK